MAERDGPIDAAGPSPHISGMKRRSILSRGARATIAVVALYGLVLQAFLTSLAFPAAVQAHGLSELCSPAQDEGSGVPAGHRRHECCLLASASHPPPQGGASALAWPPRIAIVLAPAAAAPPPARAPPTDGHSPRGPPAA